MKARKYAVQVNGKEIEAEEGTGNIFADLGLSNPEERLAKAELTRQIAMLIAKKKLTQAAAGKLLGISQPRVNRMLRGRLTEFSTDTLMKYLSALGSNIEVVVTNRPRARGPGSILVRCA